jgi:hypothetical protein
MADKLNENAEFGRRNKDEEDPILVAQRFLNIYRQMHIFNTERQQEFDQMLLKMPSDVRLLLSTLPGGSVLISHIEELEQKNGLTSTQTTPHNPNKPSALKKKEPDTARTASGNSGGNVIIDSSFASELSSSLSMALQQTEKRYKEDIKTLTKTLTESIMESQSAIGQMIKDILLSSQQAKTRFPEQTQLMRAEPKKQQNNTAEPAKRTESSLSTFEKTKNASQKPDVPLAVNEKTSGAFSENTQNESKKKKKNKHKNKDSSEYSSNVQNVVLTPVANTQSGASDEEKVEERFIENDTNKKADDASFSLDELMTDSSSEADIPSVDEINKELSSEDFAPFEMQNFDDNLNLPTDHADEDLNLPTDDMDSILQAESVSDTETNGSPYEDELAQIRQALQASEDLEPQKTVFDPTPDDDVTDDDLLLKIAKSVLDQMPPLNVETPESESSKPLPSEKNEAADKPIASSDINRDTKRDEKDFEPVSIDEIESAPISLDDLSFETFEPEENLTVSTPSAPNTPPRDTLQPAKTPQAKPQTPIEGQAAAEVSEDMSKPDDQSPSASDDGDWEWEYVEDDGSDGSDDSDWEWEYVEDDGSDGADDSDWEWEYVEDDTDTKKP